MELDQDRKLVGDELCVKREDVVLARFFEFDADVLGYLIRCHVAHVTVCREGGVEGGRQREQWQ